MLKNNDIDFQIEQENGLSMYQWKKKGIP